MNTIIRFPTCETGDKVCVEQDGCPTEKAVLQRYWRETQKKLREAADLTDEIDELNFKLDDSRIPRADGEMMLSLWGRVKRFAATIAAQKASDK